ncbi:MAG: class I SAM-dependent methyltransferase [Desulfobulbaceae bacterium]|jgi:methyltransferase (TIGR00027 family)|nr:class I SAM-dependent methyltransferase [Desulfobulbaceae bacterium]
MNKRGISATAATTALMRALACYETAAIDGLKWRDNLAYIFVDEEKRDRLVSEGYRQAVKAKAKDGLFPYLIARTAYFDRIFLDALRDGVGQIVILGAGFDSRAYRYRVQGSETRIFERLSSR